MVFFWTNFGSWEREALYVVVFFYFLLSGSSQCWWRRRGEWRMFLQAFFFTCLFNTYMKFLGEIIWWRGVQYHQNAEDIQLFISTTRWTDECCCSLAECPEAVRGMNGVALIWSWQSWKVRVALDFGSLQPGWYFIFDSDSFAQICLMCQLCPFLQYAVHRAAFEDYLEVTTGQNAVAWIVTCVLRFSHITHQWHKLHWFSFLPSVIQAYL